MNDETQSQDDLAAEWGDALSEQAQSEKVPPGDAGRDALPQKDDVTRAALEDLESEPAARGEINLDSIVDIPITLSVEIGRTRLSIRNLLQLNQGSVVELDRLAGEPLDVMVNGTLVAHGEVVVVNEKFGVRLTDVMSAQERIKKLH